jgi:hypothetical protein
MLTFIYRLCKKHYTPSVPQKLVVLGLEVFLPKQVVLAPSPARAKRLKKMAPKHAQTRHAFSTASLTRQAQTKKKNPSENNAPQAGIKPGTAGLVPRCTCHSSYACFLFEMHPQPYLIWVGRLPLN